MKPDEPLRAYDFDIPDAPDALLALGFTCPRCGGPTDPTWYCSEGYCPQCCTDTDEDGLLHEIDGLQREMERLRALIDQAMTALDEWDAVWEAAGSPGPLGGSKAAAVAVLIEQLWLENTKLGREIDRP